MRHFLCETAISLLLTCLFVYLIIHLYFYHDMTTLNTVLIGITLISFVIYYYIQRKRKERHVHYFNNAVNDAIINTTPLYYDHCPITDFPICLRSINGSEVIIPPKKNKCLYCDKTVYSRDERVFYLDRLTFVCYSCFYNTFIFSLIRKLCYIPFIFSSLSLQVVNELVFTIRHSLYFSFYAHFLSKSITLYGSYENDVYNHFINVKEVKEWFWLFPSLLLPFNISSMKSDRNMRSVLFSFRIKNNEILNLVANFTNQGNFIHNNNEISYMYHEYEHGNDEKPVRFISKGSFSSFYHAFKFIENMYIKVNKEEIDNVYILLLLSLYILENCKIRVRVNSKEGKRTILYSFNYKNLL